MPRASILEGQDIIWAFLIWRNMAFPRASCNQIVASFDNPFLVFSKTFSKMKRIFAVRRPVTASVVKMSAKDTPYVIALGYK